MSDDNVIPTTGPGRRRRWIVIAASFVVVILIVVFVLVALRSGGTSSTSRSTSTSQPTASSSVRPSSTPPPSPTSTPLPSAGTREPAVTGTSASPAPLTSPARVVSGVSVSIGKLTAVAGKGDGIGEIDGPAIRFQVVFDNATAKPVSLDTVVVSVTHGGDETPANELESARTPLPGTLAARSSATGVYTFTLPEADRNDIRITVDYRAGIPVTVFSGNAPEK